MGISTYLEMRLCWLAPLVAAMLLLLYPAIYNGFPLVFYDTGGYLERPYVTELAPGRIAVYGLLMLAFEWELAWWPLLILQAAVVIWLLYLIARTHDVPHGPGAMAALVALLAIGTGLPWYAAQLMPDILASVAVLSLYLLAFRSHRLCVRERVGLMIAGTVAVGSHMSHLGLAVGLLGVITVAWWPVAREQSGRGMVRLALPAVVVVLGGLLVPVGNGIASGHFRMTPGGTTFIFGRMLQDGIVARFLDDHCPSPEYRLCSHRDELPGTANEFIWGGNSPFAELGGWDGLAPEMTRIIGESLYAYPGLHVGSAVLATAQQIAQVATGDGLDTELYHTRWSVERFEPDLLPSYDAAAQQRGELGFAEMNRFQVPIAYAAMLASTILLVSAARRGDRAMLMWIGFILAALLGNAFICGVLSNVHDRYEGRLVWLLVAGVWVAVWRRNPSFIHKFPEMPAAPAAEPAEGRSFRRGIG